MTAIWTITGDAFSANPVGFSPPITAGLKGWWYLGGTSAKTTRNLAFNGDAALVGSPTIEEGYVSFAGFSGGQWMQTTLAETENDTLLVVARSAAAFSSGSTRPHPIGNTGPDAGFSGTEHGSAILVYETVGAPSAGVRGVQSHDGGAGTPVSHLTGQITVTDLTDFKFLAKSFNDTSNTKLTRNVTDSQSTSNTNTGARILHTTNTHRIGGSYTSTYGGPCDVAFAAIYDTALTSDQMGEIYEFVARYLSDKFSIEI